MPDGEIRISIAAPRLHIPVDGVQRIVVSGDEESTEVESYTFLVMV